MVLWLADGEIVGYDPIDNELEMGVFKFVTPEVPVDVQGATRLQRQLNTSEWSPSSYPNRLSAKVEQRITTADFYGTTDGSVVRRNLMMVVKHPYEKGYDDSWVPSISDFFDSSGPLAYPYGANRSVWAPSEYVPYSLVAGGPVDATFNFAGPAPGFLQHNTKFWVCLYPTLSYNLGAPAGQGDHNLWLLAPSPEVKEAEAPRAISIWTNRTPRKPTITAPASGSSILPGLTFTFSYTTDDPDTVSPDDAARTNRDLAGIEVQWREAPSSDNPNPTWRALNYYNAQGDPRVSGKWIIGAYSHVEGMYLPVEDLGMPVLAGEDLSDEGPPNTGIMPKGGDFQLRMRQFDFSHPYPMQVPPLGVGDPISYFAQGLPYPTENTSDWSETVTITIPAQVPPPVPVTPRDSRAFRENLPIRLQWTYRNTKRPTPAEQKTRWVQIRKVGDPEWATVFAGPSTDYFVDLPPVLDNPPPFAPTQLLGPAVTDTDLDWLTSDPLNSGPDGTEDIVLAAMGGQDGLNVVGVEYSGASGYPGLSRIVELDPEMNVLDFLGFSFSDETCEFRNVWGTWIEWNPPSPPVVIGVRGDAFGVTVSKPGGGWPTGNPARWSEFAAEGLKIPANATHIVLDFFAFSLVEPLSHSTYADNLSLIGSSSFNTDDFTLEATTYYEWRVRVEDTDGEESDWSEPARFWVVPEGADPGARPIPGDLLNGASLGCGTYSVVVYKRGGRVEIGRLEGIERLEWNRVRDDVSTARVDLKGFGPDCGRLLAGLRTWACEIAIIRDNGYSVDRVWEGPLTLIKYENDKVTLNAKDVMAFVYRRAIRNAMNDSTGSPTAGRTVVERAGAILRDVFAPDDPNILEYLQEIAQSDDTKQYRNTPAYARTAFEEVDDMASNQGLDYTAVGRRILLWGTKRRIGTLPEFHDKDLSNAPIVSEYGMSFATGYIVSDGNGLWGRADIDSADPVSGNDPDYGIIEMLSSSWASDEENPSGTYTNEARDKVRASFAESAARSLSHRNPPPVIVRVPDNTTVNPDTVISVQHLVPGVAIPLRSSATLRDVRSWQKLDSVKCVVTDKGETISISMSPLSSDDVQLEE